MHEARSLLEDSRVEGARLHEERRSLHAVRLHRECGSVVEAVAARAPPLEVRVDDDVLVERRRLGAVDPARGQRRQHLAVKGREGTSVADDDAAVEELERFARRAREVAVEEVGIARRALLRRRLGETVALRGLLLLVCEAAELGGEDDRLVECEESGEEVGGAPAPEDVACVDEEEHLAGRRSSRKVEPGVQLERQRTVLGHRSRRDDAEVVVRVGSQHPHRERHAPEQRELRGAVGGGRVEGDHFPFGGWCTDAAAWQHHVRDSGERRDATGAEPQRRGRRVGRRIVDAVRAELGREEDGDLHWREADVLRVDVERVGFCTRRAERAPARGDAAARFGLLPRAERHTVFAFDVLAAFHRRAGAAPPAAPAADRHKGRRRRAPRAVLPQALSARRRPLLPAVVAHHVGVARRRREQPVARRVDDDARGAASAVAPQHGRDLRAARVRSALPPGQIGGGVCESVRQFVAQQRAHVRIMEECEGLLLYGGGGRNSALLGARVAPDRLRRCAAQQVERAKQHDEQRSQRKSRH